MSLGKTFSVDGWPIETAEAAESLLAVVTTSVPVPVAACEGATSVYRPAGRGPLNRLSVGLIDTYKHINEVRLSLVSLITNRLEWLV